MAVVARIKKTRRVTLTVSVPRSLLDKVKAFATAEGRSVPNALVHAASLTLESSYLNIAPSKPEVPGDHRIIPFVLPQGGDE